MGEFVHWVVYLTVGCAVASGGWWLNNLILTWAGLESSVQDRIGPTIIATLITVLFIMVVLIDCVKQAWFCLQQAWIHLKQASQSQSE